MVRNPLVALCSILFLGFLGCAPVVDRELQFEVVHAPSQADEGATGFSPSTPVEAHDWPNFLGPQRNASADDADVQLDWPPTGPQELWRIEVGTGYSSPIVQGDDLIVMHRLGDDELVECFSSATGRSKWKFAYATSYECPYQYSDGPYSTPAIDDGRVYAWGAEGVLHCLDLQSGELIWRRDLNDDYDAELGMFPVAGSVFIEGDLVILNVGGRKMNAGVVALDKNNGTTRWISCDHGPGDATAVAATIHGRRCLFMFTSDGLVSLDPATGSMHWQLPFRATAADTSNATTPVVEGDKVFISAYKKGSLCLRIQPDGSYSELWQDRRNLQCQFRNLIARDGFVYGFSAGDHSLRCIDLETGEVCWKWHPKHRRGQSLAIGNRLIVIFETGHLAAIDVSPAGHQVRCLTEDPIVKAGCFSFPALAGGRLYLRSDTDVVCLDMTRATSK